MLLRAAPIPLYWFCHSILPQHSRIRAGIRHHHTLFVYTRECMLCKPTPVNQCFDRGMWRHSTIAGIVYCLYPPLRLHTLIYHVHISFSFHSLNSNDYHFLLRVGRDCNIFFQIMVTSLSYVSNACHSLSGVAERLQHTEINC